MGKQAARMCIYIYEHTRIRAHTHIPTYLHNSYMHPVAHIKGARQELFLK